MAFQAPLTPGSRISVEWPLTDGRRSSVFATIEQAQPSRKRSRDSDYKYKLAFDDGDVRFSRLKQVKWSLLNTNTQLGPTRNGCPVATAVEPGASGKRDVRADRGQSVAAFGSVDGSSANHTSSGLSRARQSATAKPPVLPAAPLRERASSAAQLWQGALTTSVHPFQISASDHCETPRDAYEDIAPFLEKIARDLGKTRESLRIYDPYYCEGTPSACLYFEGSWSEYPSSPDRPTDRPNP